MICLITCNNLKSAEEFCKRGQSKHVGDPHLLDLHQSLLIKVEGLRRGESEAVSVEEYPDRGFVRRELYAWNTYEPDRYSDQAVRSLNEAMKKVAPKLEVRVTKLEDLTSNSEQYVSIFLLLLITKAD